MITRIGGMYTVTRRGMRGSVRVFSLAAAIAVATFGISAQTLGGRMAATIAGFRR